MAKSPVANRGFRTRSCPALRVARSRFSSSWYLIGIGFLTAIKRPGWQVLGILLGIVYLYLGIVAITIPNEIGSWGTVGGILSILGGVAYLVLTVWEMRRSTPANSEVIR